MNPAIPMLDQVERMPTVALCAISFALMSVATPVSPQNNSLKFEVASIRPIPPGTLIPAQALGIACRGRDGVRQTTTAVKPQVDPVLTVPQGRCTANGITAQSLIAFAYGIPEGFVSGGPNWVRHVGPTGLEPTGFSFRETETFSIEAAASDPATVTSEQLRQMLRTMLADRFDLVFHRETRQVKGFELVVAKGGTKLKTTSDAYESPRVLFDESLRRVIKGASRLKELADVLLPAREPVVDKTGLTGVYSYEFFAPLPPPPPPAPPGAQGAGRGGPGGPGELQAPSNPAAALSSSLESTLGLRLQAATVSAEMLVIDTLNRPSAN
jgi:uncharacterized protein (TIGR03435 family)